MFLYINLNCINSKTDKMNSNCRHYEQSKQLIKDLNSRMSKSLEQSKRVNLCLTQ